MMNTIDLIILNAMQNFSESDALIRHYESLKDNYWQTLVDLGKIKIENNQLIQLKEAESSSLLGEIAIKRGQLINEKLSFLKPIKSMSNLLENKKIENEISHIHENNKKIQENIDKTKNLLFANERRILETSKQYDETVANIEFIRNKKELGFELFHEKWVKIEEIPKLQETKIGLANNFANMSPFDFEHFVARLLKEMGYKTEVTKKTGDFGTDIIAKKGNKITAVQCKRHNEKNLVGNKLIQQLLGSMNFYHATQCIFVTTSYYTKPAIKQAENAPIELWDKDTFHKLVKKHLLNLDIDQIFTAIEKEKQKERERIEVGQNAVLERKRLNDEKKQLRIAKAEIKRQTDKEKRICPQCGGGKLSRRKYCSKCTKENRRDRRNWY